MGTDGDALTQINVQSVSDIANGQSLLVVSSKFFILNA